MPHFSVLHVYFERSNLQGETYILGHPFFSVLSYVYQKSDLLAESPKSQVSKMVHCIFVPQKLKAAEQFLSYVITFFCFLKMKTLVTKTAPQASIFGVQKCTVPF